MTQASDAVLRWSSFPILLLAVLAMVATESLDGSSSNKMETGSVGDILKFPERSKRMLALSRGVHDNSEAILHRTSRLSDNNNVRTEFNKRLVDDDGDDHDYYTDDDDYDDGLDKTGSNHNGKWQENNNKDYQRSDRSADDLINPDAIENDNKATRFVHNSRRFSDFAPSGKSRINGNEKTEKRAARFDALATFGKLRPYSTKDRKKRAVSRLFRIGKYEIEEY